MGSAMGGRSVGKVPEPCNGRLPGGNRKGRGATLRAAEALDSGYRAELRETDAETHPNGSKKARLLEGQEADGLKGPLVKNQQLPEFAGAGKRGEVGQKGVRDWRGKGSPNRGPWKGGGRSQRSWCEWCGVQLSGSGQGP